MGTAVPPPPTLEDILAVSTPYWIRRPQAQASQPLPASTGAPASSYVDPRNPDVVGIVDPKTFTQPVAAHEAAHTYQFGRNSGFIDNLNALLPQGTQNAGVYDYGGVGGLQANHPNIGRLNSEQQAQIVQDLTQAQHALPAHPNLHQLAQWDTTKAALERPIQQLMAIPPAETGVAGKIDAFTHARGMGDPMQYMKTLLGMSPMNVAPMSSTPGPSSVALGYPSLSKLVR